MKHVCLILSCFMILACGTKQENIFHDKTLQELYTLQDGRSSAALIPYLKDEDHRYRRAAALAFASIQDKSAVPHLAALLADPAAEVRRAAAYALGQVGSDEAEPMLTAACKQEEEVSVKRDILEALGKCGTTTGLEFLVDLDFNEGSELLLTGQARGIFRFSLRNIISIQGSEKMIELLTHETPEPAAIVASNYLARLRGADLTPYSQQLLKAFSEKSDVFVRANLALAMAKAKHPQVLAFLKTLLAPDWDYRIRVNALRAIANFADPDTNEIVFDLLKDNNGHVAVQAASYFLAGGAAQDAQRYYDAARSMKNWRGRALMLAAALKYAKNKEEREKVSAAIIAAYQASQNSYEKGSLLNALAQDPRNHPFVSEQAFANVHRVVKTYAMAALAAMRMHPGFNEEWASEFAAIFKNAIQSGDIAMIGLASAVLRNPRLNFKTVYKGDDFLKQALNKLELPRDIEAYQQLQATIAFFEGRQAPEPSPAKKTKNPIDWQQVTALAPDQEIIIKTTKGDIAIRLLVNDAPGSAANFVRLINDGFYDNNPFHRVVANFVIQAGCTRGDGWGSPPFSIRSEFGPLYYGEGTLGMASAGKDTESSQWFITHSPTPHLDGRYTIFGRVISGMDTVHKIEMGDRILAIKLKN